MHRFPEFHERSEQQIAWLLDRMAGDDQLAGLLTRPGISGLLVQERTKRSVIEDYRRAAHRVEDATGPMRWWWFAICRHRARALEVMAAGYR